MDVSSGLTQEIGGMGIGLHGILSGTKCDFLYELIEGHIFEFGEPIQAHHRLTANSLDLRSTWSSWDRMREVLKGLAFNLNHKNPLHGLGLSLQEGPPAYPLIHPAKAADCSAYHQGWFGDASS